jgi:hypothetical protein
MFCYQITLFVVVTSEELNQDCHRELVVDGDTKIINEMEYISFNKLLDFTFSIMTDSKVGPNCYIIINVE